MWGEVDVPGKKKIFARRSAVAIRRSGGSTARNCEFYSTGAGGCTGTCIHMMNQTNQHESENCTQSCRRTQLSTVYMYVNINSDDSWCIDTRARTLGPAFHNSPPIPRAGKKLPATYSVNASQASSYQPPHSCVPDRHGLGAYCEQCA